MPRSDASSSRWPSSCSHRRSARTSEEADQRSNAGRPRTDHRLRVRPRNLTIARGTVVRWVNRGARTHTDVEHGPVEPQPGARRDLGRRFRRMGTFAYHCSIHPADDGADQRHVADEHAPSRLRSSPCGAAGLGCGARGPTAHDRVHARERLRADEQLHRHRQGARTAGAPRRVRGRGVVEGKLEPLGFEEDLVDLSPPAEGDQDAGQFWIDFVAETAPEFRKPTIEQLAAFIEPVWSSLIDGAVYATNSSRRSWNGPSPTSSSRTTSTAFRHCSPTARPG